MLYRRRQVLFAAGAAWLAAQPARAQDAYAAARAQMVREIERDAKAAAATTRRERLADHVIAAMRKVPRHRFVAPELAAVAYDNRPLPIGEGQTISQPFIVALMTDLAQPRRGARVLEVGTGSGYQAAVLAECGANVYTIEIVHALGERAAAVLKELGYTGVETRIGDGYKGWPEAAPFDAILVTAAPDHIPQPLLDQLKPGGRMVIPVGSQIGGQDLLVIEKDRDGRTIKRTALPVRFVPLTRERK